MHMLDPITRPPAFMEELRRKLPQPVTFDIDVVRTAAKSNSQAERFVKAFDTLFSMTSLLAIWEYTHYIPFNKTFQNGENVDLCYFNDVYRKAREARIDTLRRKWVAYCREIIPLVMEDSLPFHTLVDPCILFYARQKIQ